jgi:ribonucleotide reductase beta subunit family protein with ferritin-like domain
MTLDTYDCLYENKEISCEFKRLEKNDPLLIENNNRYVMFPIKYHNFWKMYKKRLASFWVVESVDLSHDTDNWYSLSDQERHFISHALAFFAVSNSIVLDDLSTKFSNEIQHPEIRAFYGFQIAIENIHCVAGNTKILTDNGYYMIKNLENKYINVWNGEGFSNVEIKYTSNQEIYNVILSNGMVLNCSPGHKWLIGNYKKTNVFKLIEKKTIDLHVNDKIIQYELPIINIYNNPSDFFNPYSHGLFCCNNKLNGNLYGNKKKYYVPINYTITTKLRWLEGVSDVNGHVILNNKKDSTIIRLHSINYDFISEIQLLLTTLNIQSSISTQYLMNKYNNSKDAVCQNLNVLYINGKNVNKLIYIGFSPKKLKILYCERLNHLKTKLNIIRIKSIIKISNNEATYCFNEPIKHRGVFNGILTSQSEMYSTLIDFYMRDYPFKKHNMFNAILTTSAIKLKAEWAIKWFNDSKSFTERIIAFAVVKNVFFSGYFCSIVWLKKRGLMPGLTSSNELILRDERLHADFSCMIYNTLHNKLPKRIINNIISSAVDVEKTFIIKTLPCDLIGINCKSMSTYIEYVADKLLISLGCDKLYNSINPFDWMELIQDETELLSVKKYKKQNHNVISDSNIFELNDDF